MTRNATLKSTMVMLLLLTSTLPMDNAAAQGPNFNQIEVSGDIIVVNGGALHGLKLDTLIASDNPVDARQYPPVIFTEGGITKIPIAVATYSDENEIKLTVAFQDETIYRWNQDAIDPAKWNLDTSGQIEHAGKIISLDYWDRYTLMYTIQSSDLIYFIDDTNFIPRQMQQDEGGNDITSISMAGIAPKLNDQRQFMVDNTVNAISAAAVSNPDDTQSVAALTMSGGGFHKMLTMKGYNEPFAGPEYYGGAEYDSSAPIKVMDERGIIGHTPWGLDSVTNDDFGELQSTFFVTTNEDNFLHILVPDNLFGAEWDEDIWNDPINPDEDNSPPNDVFAQTRRCGLENPTATTITVDPDVADQATYPITVTFDELDPFTYELADGVEVEGGVITLQLGKLPGTYDTPLERKFSWEEISGRTIDWDIPRNDIPMGADQYPPLADNTFRFAITHVEHESQLDDDQNNDIFGEDWQAFWDTFCAEVTIPQPARHLGEEVPGTQTKHAWDQTAFALTARPGGTNDPNAPNQDLTRLHGDVSFREVAKIDLTSIVGQNLFDLTVDASIDLQPIVDLLNNNMPNIEVTSVRPAQGVFDPPNFVQGKNTYFALTYNSAEIQGVPEHVKILPDEFEVQLRLSGFEVNGLRTQVVDYSDGICPNCEETDTGELIIRQNIPYAVGEKTIIIPQINTEQRNEPMIWPSRRPFVEDGEVYTIDPHFIALDDELEKGHHAYELCVNQDDDFPEGNHGAEDNCQSGSTPSWYWDRFELAIGTPYLLEHRCETRIILVGGCVDWRDSVTDPGVNGVKSWRDSVGCSTPQQHLPTKFSEYSQPASLSEISYDPPQFDQWSGEEIFQSAHCGGVMAYILNVGREMLPVSDENLPQPSHGDVPESYWFEEVESNYQNSITTHRRSDRSSPGVWLRSTQAWNTDNIHEWIQFEGTVSVEYDSRTVTGIGTEFTNGDIGGVGSHGNQNPPDRIDINGNVLYIDRIIDDTHLELLNPYMGIGDEEATLWYDLSSDKRPFFDRPCIASMNIPGFDEGPADTPGVCIQRTGRESVQVRDYVLIRDDVWDVGQIIPEGTFGEAGIDIWPDELITGLFANGMQAWVEDLVDLIADEDIELLLATLQYGAHLAELDPSGSSRGTVIMPFEWYASMARGSGSGFDTDYVFTPWKGFANTTINNCNHPESSNLTELTLTVPPNDNYFIKPTLAYVICSHSNTNNPQGCSHIPRWTYCTQHSVTYAGANAPWDGDPHIDQHPDTSGNLHEVKEYNPGNQNPWAIEKVVKLIFHELHHSWEMRHDNAWQDTSWSGMAVDLGDWDTWSPEIMADGFSHSRYVHGNQGYTTDGFMDGMPVARYTNSMQMHGDPPHANNSEWKLEKSWMTTEDYNKLLFQHYSQGESYDDFNIFKIMFDWVGDKVCITGEPLGFGGIGIGDEVAGVMAGGVNCAQIRAENDAAVANARHAPSTSNSIIDPNLIPAPAHRSLKFSGRTLPNGTIIRLDVSSETTHVMLNESNTTPNSYGFEVQMFNANGEIINSSYLRTVEFYPILTVFSGEIPFSEEATGWKMIKRATNSLSEDQVIFEHDFPSNYEIQVNESEITDHTLLAGTIPFIQWSDNSPFPGDVEYEISITHDGGLTWDHLGRTFDQFKRIPLNFAPHGEENYIQIRGTDHYNSDTAIIGPFTISGYELGIVNQTATMVESQSSFWAAVEVSPSENMTGNLWLSSETPFVNLEWFDSPSVDLSNGISTVTFEVTPDADLTNGYYMVEIRGFSNGLERTIPVTFTIFNGPPPPEIPPITYYSEDFNATESPTTQDTDSTSCMIWLTDNTIDVSACIEDTSEQAEEPSEEPNPDTDKTPEDGFTRSGIYLIAGIFCLLALAVVARKTE